MKYLMETNNNLPCDLLIITLKQPTLLAFNKVEQI